MPRVSVDWTAK